MKTRKSITAVLIILNCFVFIVSAYIGIRLWGKYLPKPPDLSRLFPSPYRCPDCNVILVSLDTLSANHLPCYGYERNTAPHLCDFARNNIMFDNMFANAHYTLPSHTTMFTGLLATTHNVNATYQDSLSPSLPFLPQVLQKNGYETYFSMFDDDANMPLDTVYNRGISKLVPEIQGSLTPWKELINTMRKNTARGKKTFLFLHTYFVHTPYIISGKKMYTDKSFANIPTTYKDFETCNKTFTDDLVKIIKTTLDRKEWFEKTKDYERLYNDLKTAKDPEAVCRAPQNKLLIRLLRYNYFFTKDNITTPEMAVYLKDLYDQKINELDTELDKFLLSVYNQPDIKSKTIVIITADHGEEFMEHNELIHTTLYDSNVRVPLIIALPKAGPRKILTNAQTADLMPTILDMLRIKNDIPSDGESLVKDIAMNSNRPKLVTAFRAYEQLVTIRDDRYKLFTHRTEDNRFIPLELYDTKQDRGETNNILLSHPEATAALLKQLPNMIKEY